MPFDSLAMLETKTSKSVEMVSEAYDASQVGVDSHAERL
jgi:hypothetical protein